MYGIGFMLILVLILRYASSAPQGYNYQRPSSASPQYPTSEIGASTPVGFGIPNVAAEVNQFSSGTASMPVSGIPSFIQTTNFIPTTILPLAPSHSSNSFQSISSGSSSFGVSTLSTAPNLGESSNNGHLSSQQGPIITKHFYLHTAPEDPEEEIEQEQVNLGPVRKTYRVVFIKAPVQSSRATAISLNQPRDEEKTVIYVLTKKVDTSNIKAQIQTAPHQPSKPEVFFIKYKTTEEAQHVQKHIQAQYDALGGTSQFSDEGIAPITSVIGITDGSQAHSSDTVSRTTINSSTSVDPSNPHSFKMNPSRTYLPQSA